MAVLLYSATFNIARGISFNCGCTINFEGNDCEILNCSVKFSVRLVVTGRLFIKWNDDKGCDLVKSHYSESSNNKSSLKVIRWPPKHKNLQSNPHNLKLHFSCFSGEHSLCGLLCRFCVLGGILLLSGLGLVMLTLQD